MCVVVAELSERWTVDLEVRAIQVRTRQKYFPLIFIRTRWLKLFYSSGIQLNNFYIIRREYQPKDVFGPEVATNLQLNRKFLPLFII